MPIKIKNDAKGVLSAPFSIGDTALTLQAGHGARFDVADTGTNPMPTAFAGSDAFRLTLVNALGQHEIVHVRTHGAGSDSFSDIIRAQEGTIERDWDTGTFVSNRLSGADITAMLSQVDGVAELARLAAEAAAATAVPDFWSEGDDEATTALDVDGVRTLLNAPDGASMFGIHGLFVGAMRSNIVCAYNLSAGNHIITGTGISASVGDVLIFSYPDPNGRPWFVQRKVTTYISNNEVYVDKALPWSGANLVSVMLNARSEWGADYDNWPDDGTPNAWRPTWGSPYSSGETYYNNILQVSQVSTGNIEMVLAQPMPNDVINLVGCGYGALNSNSLIYEVSEGTGDKYHTRFTVTTQSNSYFTPARVMFAVL